MTPIDMQLSWIGLLYGAVSTVNWETILVVGLAALTLRSSRKIEQTTASNTAVAASQASIAIEQEKLLLFRAFREPLLRLLALIAYIKSKTYAIDEFHGMFVESIHSHIPSGTGVTPGPAPISRGYSPKEKELKDLINREEIELLALKREFAFTLFALMTLKVGPLCVLERSLWRLKALTDLIEQDTPPLDDINQVLMETVGTAQKMTAFSYENLQRAVQRVNPHLK